VRDGETGVLTPPRDPAALADALENLLRDRARAQRLGDAGRRHVVELTPTRVAERFVAAVQSMSGIDAERERRG
jgi:glycosyltransferase involved in cell wall biosynthesis